MLFTSNTMKTNISDFALQRSVENTKTRAQADFLFAEIYCSEIAVLVMLPDGCIFGREQYAAMGAPPSTACSILWIPVLLEFLPCLLLFKCKTAWAIAFSAGILIFFNMRRSQSWQIISSILCYILITLSKNTQVAAILLASRLFGSVYLKVLQN